MVPCLVAPLVAVVDDVVAEGASAFGLAFASEEAGGLHCFGPYWEAGGLCCFVPCWAMVVEPD